MAETFFERVHKQDTHMPDVLSCLANLSNDEVFTPPDLVNKVLDLLPQELFKDPSTKFLDPATKTGVFLREIAKRLLVGLEPIYPDLQERIDHIFHEQLYGIAITELTSLLARRSLYCSKYPNGKYSISSFNNPEGNITFKKIQHTWEDGKCIYCGASQEMWDRNPELETHAYGFIHCGEEYNKEYFERLKNMKFDVILGNPPYQLSDGGNAASAKPLYHLFVEQAKRLNPRYITMIIPARWFSGGKGLDNFRDEMLCDTRIRVLHDFLNAGECFPGVEIKGGICYFLWDRDNAGKCRINTHKNNNIISSMERNLKEGDSEVFIRYNQAIPILHKVQNKREKTMDQQVSSRKPFGFATNFNDYEKRSFHGGIKIYARGEVGYVSKKLITTNKELLNKIKVYVPAVFGEGSGGAVPDRIKPIIATESSCCTETYLIAGSFNSLEEANNLKKYMETNFFHFLIALKKNTQHATRSVYSFVPVQDYTQEWTDAKLYKKYGLTKEEINFIESMIKPMEDK